MQPCSADAELLDVDCQAALHIGVVEPLREDRPSAFTSRAIKAALLAQSVDA